MMRSFSINERNMVECSVNAPNIHIYLGMISFCALSLMIGYLISYSILYAILALGALLGIVVCVRPEIGLYLMIFLIPFNEISQIAGSLTLIKLIGIVVLAGWVLNVAVTKKPINIPREGWYLIAFITWGLISSFWAVDPTKVVRSIPTLIQLVGFYVIVVNLAESKERIYLLFGILLAGCLVASGMTLVYFAEASMQGGQIERISVGDDLNHYQASLLVVIPFLLLSIIFAKSQAMRFALVGVAGLVLMSFFLGMSRGAILALMVIVSVMLVKLRRYLPRLIIFIPIVLLASLYFMPESFWQRMVSGFSFEDKGAGRFTIWTAGWNMIMDNPLVGVGLSDFSAAYDLYDTDRGISMRAPHSIYLGTLAELGVVGIALLFLAFVSHLKSAVKALRFFEEKKDQSGQIIILSVVLSFIGLLVVGIALDILYRKYFWLSMAFIVAMSLMASDNNLGEAKKIASHSPSNTTQ